MKKFLYVVFVLALSLSIPSNAYAMHIAEGYLQLSWVVFYFILSAPFIILSIRELRKLIKKNHDIKITCKKKIVFVKLNHYPQYNLEPERQTRLLKRHHQ